MSDQRRNIQERLGIPQWVAEEVHELWPKGAFTLARLVRDAAIEKGFCDKRVESVADGFYTDAEFNKEAKFRRSIFTPTHMRDMRRDLTIIRDWLGARSKMPDAIRGEVNLKTTSLQDLVKMSKEWHKNLEVRRTTSGFRRDEDKGTVFLEFDNGWYWVNLHKSRSAEESRQLGHCGEDHGYELISLRDEKKNSHLTLSRNKKTGVVNQFRGKRNTPPSKKYDYYIFKLFEQTTFPITGFLLDKFPIKIMRKYMANLMEIDHMRDLIFSSNKYAIEIWSFINFKGMSDREIMRNLMRRHGLKNRTPNIELFHTIVENGINKKPWFDWTCVALDVIADRRSTPEDLKELMASNWFNHTDDLGTITRRDGTLGENLIIEQRMDLIPTLLELCHQALDGMRFAFSSRNVKPISSRNEYIAMIRKNNDPFVHRHGTPLLTLVLARMCVSGDLDSLLLMQKAGIDLNLAALNRKGLKEEFYAYARILKNEADEILRWRFDSKTKTFKGPSFRAQFEECGSRLLRIRRICETLFGEFRVKLTYNSAEALQAFMEEEEKIMLAQKMKSEEEQRLAEKKRREREEKKVMKTSQSISYIIENYREVFLNGTKDEFRTLMTRPQTEECLNVIAGDKALIKKAMRTPANYRSKERINMILFNVIDAYYHGIEQYDMLEDFFFNGPRELMLPCLNALILMTDDNSLRWEEYFFTSDEHVWERKLKIGESETKPLKFQGNLLGLVATTSFEDRKEYELFLEEVRKRIPHGLRSYVALEVSTDGGRSYSQASLEVVDSRSKAMVRNSRSAFGSKVKLLPVKAKIQGYTQEYLAS